MKILFLDHDGVMCLTEQFGTRFTNPNKYDMDSFDKGCVKILNEIIEECSDVEIVVSSDWRHHLSIGMMREMYGSQGITKRPIGFTGCVYNGLDLEKSRCTEVLNWVSTHKVTDWCCVDDMDLSIGLGNNFVLCENSDLGIKQIGIKEKIIEKLKIK